MFLLLTKMILSALVVAVIKGMASKKVAKKKVIRGTNVPDSIWKHKESDIKKQSGIPSSIFKAIRKKLPKTEFLTRRGSCALYTEGGYYLILKMLGIREDELNVQKERHWAVITKTNIRNDFIVAGELADGKDTPVTIRVGRSGNGNFRVGMICPVRDIKDGIGILDRKNPRALGVW